MRWTLIIVLTCLYGIQCHPMTYDEEEDDLSQEIENVLPIPKPTIKIQSLFNQSTSIPIKIINSTLSTNTTEQNNEESHSERMISAESNPFANVLKAFNLPSAFAEPRLSSSDTTSSTLASNPPVTPILPSLSGPIASFIQAITPSSTTPSSLETESTTVSPVTSTSTSTSESSSTSETVNLDPNEAPTTALRYMTGNAMLDKIMNCPCAKEQLSAVGVRGVAYFNNPDPAIYRDPPYTQESLGPGDHIEANLKNVGGKTGNVFGQVIRLVLGLPTQALALLKPLVTGIADTWAGTTEAAAEVAGQKAKAIPTVIRSTAVVIKKLLETFGDVTGTLLHVVANIIASLAAAKSSVAGTLPFAFDGIGDMLKGLGAQIGAAVDLVQGTSEILSGGVVNAAKTTGNLVVGLVAGGKGFGLGLLDGIKGGLNDEPPPNSGNGQGWRR